MSAAQCSEGAMRNTALRHPDTVNQINSPKDGIQGSDRIIFRSAEDPTGPHQAPALTCQCCPEYQMVTGVRGMDGGHWSASQYNGP